MRGDVAVAGGGGGRAEDEEETSHPDREKLSDAPSLRIEREDRG